MDELVNGIFKPASVHAFQHIMRRLQLQECDAVVLGCAGIPLLMNETNSPLPILDSARLLARGMRSGPQPCRRAHLTTHPYSACGRRWQC